MRTKGLSLGLIQKICLIYIIVWAVAPPLMVDSVYRLAAVAASLVWLAVQLIRQRPLVINKDVLIALAFLILVVVVALIESGFSTSAVIKNISLIMLAFCYVICYFYRGRFSELRDVLQVALVVFIYFNIVTLIEIWSDPALARIIVRGSEETIAYLRRGVGGYSLIYSQVMIAPVVFAWVWQSVRYRRILSSVIGVTWSVTIVLYAFKANYAIALFAVVLSLIVLIFYRGKHIIGAFLIALAVFAAIMAAIYYWDAFREWLLKIFDGTAVAHKINDLVATGDSGDATGSIQSRMSRYLNSLSALIQYPIIGILWRAKGVGGHSGILDNLAKYGWFGGWAYCRMIFYPPTYYKKRFGGHAIVTVAANAAMVIFLFVLLTDSDPYSLVCSAMLLTPIAFEEIIKREEEKEREPLKESNHGRSLA